MYYANNQPDSGPGEPSGSEAPPEDPAAAEQQCRQLAARLKLPPALVAILQRRGYLDLERITAFLRPNFTDLPDPDLLLGMVRAVELIANALGARRPIVIYADYDSDGLTAGALLYLFLQQLGHRRLHYLLPHRQADGYGVHAHLLAELQTRLSPSDRPLLITVDCGISDNHAITEANRLGFEVIVTDHHRPGAQLPPAAAIINPWQAGCPFPCKNLAGAGVAFYLLMGLRRHLAGQGFWSSGQQPPNLKEYLDLVALGTVADMVPLRGANRILIRAGLEMLGAGQRPGIISLLKTAGIQNDNSKTSGPTNGGNGGNGGNGEGRGLYGEDISFILAPRLNAAGRVADPESAFKLLITQDKAEAAALAAELEELNRWRKELSDRIYREGRQRVLAPADGDQAQEAESGQAGELGAGPADGKRAEGSAQGPTGPGLAAPEIIVLADENWHPGVLGIAATRLTRDFARPVILLGREEGICKGSGRSVPGFDLLAAVTVCAGHLLGYGGHAGALGLSLKAQDLAAFRRDLLRETARRLAAAPARPEKPEEGDWFFPGGRIDPSVITYYHLLEPFGTGNPEPLFKVRGLLRHTGVVGRNHLRFKWLQPDLTLPGIAFEYGGLEIDFNRVPVELLFVLKRNFYQGRSSWQIVAKSIQPLEA